MEPMDKDTALFKFGNISRGSPSPSTSGEKPLPHYLRASTGSCHDRCKHGRKHESEEKPKNQLRRKQAKNLSMSEVINQKSSLIPEEKKKKLSVNMRSFSLKSMEVSDKPKITRHKDSSGSTEAGTSKQNEISSISKIDSASGDLALISASSNIEAVQVKSMDIGDRKKKPSLRQNSYLNRSASAEVSAMSLKVVQQKNPSPKSENGDHEKPRIPKEKANSSLQKATESFKAKFAKQTSLKSDAVQDATRNPIHKTPVHPKVIRPSAQTSIKATKKSVAKTESQLSSLNSLGSRKNKGDGNIPSKSSGKTKAAKDDGLKVSATSLSLKLSGHGELRSKMKEDINGKLTSEENQVNDNIEEKKVCIIEMQPESGAVDHLKQGDEMVVNISPDILESTLEPQPAVIDNTKFHSLRQGCPEPGINDTVCLKQKGGDDQLFQKVTELEKVSMDYVQQIPNDDQEFVIPKDFGVGFVQQRRNDSQASEELQKSEDFTADTQFKTESVESAHSGSPMENTTTSECVDLPVTQQELSAPECTNLDTWTLDITKQESSISERITLDEEVLRDQSYQVESDNEVEIEDIEEADSIYTESSEYESEKDLSENNGNVESSKTTEKRPRRAATVHPHDSTSAPHKLKFRRGRIIEPRLESNTPRKLRFRRPRAGENENDSQARRNSCREAKIKDAVSDNPESKSVVLRHQDMHGKKDAQGIFNNVIEETASKLVETRKSKVKALVGAFETVMSLQDSNSASTS